MSYMQYKELPAAAGDELTAALAMTRRRRRPLARKFNRPTVCAAKFYRMLDGVVIDDTELFNDRLQEWETFYNFNRPHGSLGGQTPYESLREKTRAPAVNEHRQLHKSGSRLGTAGRERGGPGSGSVGTRPTLAPG